MSDSIQPAQQGVIPHLVVSDAKAALQFYVQGLGAEEVFRMPEKDGDRLLHAEIRVNGARVFLCDDFPEYRAEMGGTGAPPTTLKGTSVFLHLEVANCDAAMDRAVTAGAAVAMPAMDAFWGARYGQIRDPYGHIWSFAHPLGAPGEACPLATAGEAG
ncbi:VOC family protein [Nitrospirillum pindoramense]|uniref:PhnB protein n=1 Tax=Nitrospirillum amazonense TaxID=28077 RepID=A0A560HFL2_9PROT|nr:VOC family protein [Nitrospirillum amazonense]TWB44409.1 PhnB protein [Nitrospirillum amazonense]